MPCLSRLAICVSLAFSRAITVTLAQDSSARCYWPDGSLDTSSYVCNTTAANSGGVSACCSAGDECYTSGTCFQSWSGIQYRQSCTDSTWKSPTCPQMCLGQGQLSLGVWIQSCDLKTATACCVGSDNCCGNTTSAFEFKPGLLVAVLGNPGGLDRLSQASSTSHASNSASSTFAAGSASTASTGATSVPINTDSASTITPNTPAIVAGVILGAGFALACIGMLFFWRKWQSEKKRYEGLIAANATGPNASQAHNNNNASLSQNNSYQVPSHYQDQSHYQNPSYQSPASYQTAVPAPKYEIMDHSPNAAQLDSDRSGFPELQGSPADEHGLSRGS